jgi:hypothetical protein
VRLMVSAQNLPPQTISATPTLETFLPSWRQALRNRETVERAFWEGRPAYADLERTGYLVRVRLEEEDEGGICPTRQLPKICSAINAYKRDMNQVRGLIDRQKIHTEWLGKKEREFRSKANLVAGANPSLANDLKRIAKRIHGTKHGLRLALKNRWKHNFGLILPIKGHEKLVQERQLDSQFQVRLGAIFRTFMPRNPLPLEKEARGPSLRTVARLIVLFLVCAELAEVKDGRARLRHNHRPITVDGVLQQLRGAKVDS